MPLLIIPFILIIIFSVNSLATYFLDSGFFLASTNAIAFLFSWGFIDTSREGVLTSTFQLLNFFKIVFWLTVIVVFMHQLIKHRKRLYTSIKK